VRRILASVLLCHAQAAANILTNPQLDPFGEIPEYKFCAAKVEPVAIPAAAG
jgi:formate dehydrogenase major subunit